jgi:hypothetical protein
VHLEIGQLAWELGDLPSAVDAFRSAILIEPGSRPALAALERIYDLTGQTEDRLDILERELECWLTDGEPEQAELLRTLTSIDETLTAKDDLPALEKCYIAVVERLPEGSELLPRLRQRLDELRGGSLAQREAADGGSAKPASGAEWQTLVSELTLLDDAQEPDATENRRGDTHGEPEGEGTGGVRGRAASTPRRPSPG